MKKNKEAVNDINSNQTDTEVLIVGAGMTGLTMACDLQRRGIDFRIVEKSPRYFPGSRGKGLTPRSLEVFDDIGVISSLMPMGYFHPIMREYDCQTVLRDVDLHAGIVPTSNTPYASPFWIPQFQIEHTLRAYLAEGGRHVELATEVIRIEQNESFVTATTRHNGQLQQIKCLYLVAADGAHSFVRKYLEVGFVGETRDAIRLLVGDVHADKLDHEHTHMWKNHPDGVVALTPFPKIEIFQFQAQVTSDFNAEPTLDLFQQILHERTGMDIKLKRATWLSSFKVNIRMVERSIIGRVFIAGDAAHVHSPAGGQGMNTGIQDAYNLGWKMGLVLRGANDKLLDTYQEERLPVASKVLKLSTQMLDKFLSPQRVLPDDRERFQLSLNYRNCSLSKQTDLQGSYLKAGDRAPDAALQGEKSRPIRLFDLFRGPHFTVLFSGHALRDVLTEIAKNVALKVFEINFDPQRFQSDNHFFSDVDGHFRSAYGNQSGLIYLVRPDGYIGFVGDQTKVQELIFYVDKLLAP